MAKVKGMAATNYVGKLGPAVFYIRHGVNINRALAAEPSNPQTAEQMTQRNRLTNVVRAYQANKAWMELFAYESVPQGRTLYNEFVSQNLPSSFVYLTKAEVAVYTLILAPYRFTRGTLPAITTTLKSDSNNAFNTNIQCGTAAFDSTVANFSTELVRLNNGRLALGDQLSVITNVYLADSLPEVKYYELTLDDSDNRNLADLPIYSVLTTYDDTILSVEIPNIEGTNTPCGVLVCLSRKQGSKVLVSTQNLVLNEPAIAMYTEYSGAAQQQRARRSYGGIGEPFLNPGDQTPTEVTYTVTFTGPGAEYATATGTFTEGGLVTIRCNTPSGYTFDGWSGDVTGTEFDNPMTFTITQDMTISCNISQSE